MEAAIPNIPEFSAPALDIRPSEIGVESVAAAGRRLGAYGSQIAETKRQLGSEIASTAKIAGDQAVQYAEHQNVSALARHGTDVMAAGMQSLNAYFNGDDIPDDPKNPNAKKQALDERLNNPAAAKQWLDNTLEPMLDQYREGAWTEGGQRYAERFAENLRQHLTTSAMADQSTAAGIASRDNLQKIANTSATAAYSAHNVHDLTAIINHFDGAVDANLSTSPTIKAQDRARIKEWGEQEKAKVVSAAVQGRILSGAPYDDITKAFPQYVQPGQNAQFQKQQEFYQRSIDNAKKNSLILNKQIAEAKTQSDVNDAFAKYVHVDPQTGAVTVDPKFAVTMGKLPFNNPNDPQAATHAKTWLDWNESQHKSPPRSDNPQTVSDLLGIATDSTKTLDDVKIAVAKADIAKGITPETRAQINQVATDIRNINDPFLKNAMKVAEEQLSPKITGVPVDTSKYAAFYYDFIHNQYLPAKAAGTLPPNALDINDKTSLISQAITKATGGPQATVPAAISANGGLTAPTPAAPKSPPPPQPNEIRNGYQFMGGNPADPKSWKPAS